jgi:hypothetical protein
VRAPTLAPAPASVTARTTRLRLPKSTPSPILRLQNTGQNPPINSNQLTRPLTRQDPPRPRVPSLLSGLPYGSLSNSADPPYIRYLPYNG